MSHIFKPIVLICICCIWIICLGTTHSKQCIIPTASQHSTNTSYILLCNKNSTSEIRISCGFKEVIAISDVLIGIKEGCTGNHVSSECCLFDQSDQLFDGRCLRANMYNFTNLYDRSIRRFLDEISEKQNGTLRYAFNIAIPDNFGYDNFTSSSYILFKYQCVPKPNYSTINTSTNALDILSSGSLSSNKSIYLGVNREKEDSIDNDDSTRFNEYKCLIHQHGSLIDININIFDVKFSLDENNCTEYGAKLIIKTTEGKKEVQQEACTQNSWFSPFHIHVTKTKGVLVEVYTNGASSLRNETSIWLQVENNDHHRDIRTVECGNITGILEELIASPSPNYSPGVIAGVTVCLFVVLLFGLVILIVICRKRRKRCSKEREETKGKMIPEYEYSTLLRLGEEVISRKPDKSVTYHTVTQKLKIRRDNYDNLNCNQRKSEACHEFPDDNYDHLQSITRLKIVEDPRTYDRPPAKKSVRNENQSYDHISWARTICQSILGK